MRTLFVLILLACASPAFAQPTVPPAEPYKEAAAELEKLIKHEVDDKKLPALSIALVDDQTVVWAAGFGFQDAARKIPATAETVYRVGSVSKLFTDVAVMQLVEEGKIDLDAPVAKYIPDFKPAYKEGEKPITLRMLMSHRSGLIREPPVGNYFDPDTLSLEKTVRSLNQTSLVYEPGTRTKYSNAGIAVVGLVLQRAQQQAFAKYLHKRLLDPLGMSATVFTSTDAEKSADRAAGHRVNELGNVVTLPTAPMTTRCSPSIEWTLYPNSSMRAFTSAISSLVACSFIEMIMVVCS